MSHPSYKDMVVAAIVADHHNRKGVSRAAIKSHILSEHNSIEDNAMMNACIRRAIKTLMDNGLVTQGETLQRFKVDREKLKAAQNKKKPAAPKKKKKAGKKKKTVKKKKPATKKKKKTVKKKKPASKKKKAPKRKATKKRAASKKKKAKK